MSWGTVGVRMRDPASDSLFFSHRLPLWVLAPTEPPSRCFQGLRLHRRSDLRPLPADAVVTHRGRPAGRWGRPHRDQLPRTYTSRPLEAPCLNAGIPRDVRAGPPFSSIERFRSLLESVGTDIDGEYSKPVKVSPRRRFHAVPMRSRPTPCGADQRRRMLEALPRAVADNGFEGRPWSTSSSSARFAATPSTSNSPTSGLLRGGLRDRSGTAARRPHLPVLYALRPGRAA